MICNYPECNRNRYKEKKLCNKHYLIVRDRLLRKGITRGINRKVSLEEIINYIQDKEEITTKEIKSHYEITYQTAHTYMKQLEKYQLVKYLKKGTRNLKLLVPFLIFIL